MLTLSYEKPHAEKVLTVLFETRRRDVKAIESCVHRLPVPLSAFTFHNDHLSTTADKLNVHPVHAGIIAVKQQRTTGRGMENLDNLEGMFAGAGQSGEKFVVHKEWTKEPFADDFDDEDLE